MVRALRASLILVAFAFVIGTATRAQATSITGSVTFGGDIAQTDFLTANVLDVINDVAVVNCALLGQCVGDYSTLAGAIIADYHDITLPVPAGGIIGLWSFVFGPATYSFDLLNTTSITRTADGIILLGTGTASISGFDSTPAVWSFSADNNTGLYAFSSTTTAAPVPEPGTLLLLGTGLVGGMLRRRFAK